ncbi:MAG TPA: efflux RND transporter periplasmic adaptor subunit [Desulfobulbus sp.]|nr:efflux RND transporter periplasmic adaptor subunit [Desulfobulbus sp.]
MQIKKKTWLLTCIFLIALQHQAACQSLETFLEPARLVDISTPYRDRIIRIVVREKDHVNKGTLLAELETGVLRSKLQQVKQSATVHSDIDSARALVLLRKNRLQLLKSLEKTGNVRPQELTTARTELSMAEADLQGALERQQLKRLEVKIIEAQIREKQLVSPIDGVIIKIYKQEAELLGGSDIEPLLTIAQLDPLHAVFHITPGLVRNLKQEQHIPLEVDGKVVTGVVDLISPVIDAKSGTIAVRVIVPNTNHTLRSGSRCTLTLNDTSGEPAHDQTTESTTGQSPLQ